MDREVTKDIPVPTLILLIFTTLSCSIFIGGPTYLDTPIPVSTEAQESLQTNIEKALSEAAQTGTISLQITESQLTSYLVSKLATQTDPLIIDPQVLLRNEQLKIFGKAQSGIFTANVSITTQVSVDENGHPRFAIVQSDFGPLPAPKGFNDALGTFVDEAFTGSFGPAATGFRLDSISIADGMMTITGKVK